MSPPSEPVPIYLDLRAMVLGARPDEIGLAPTPELTRVWGVLMETGFPEGIATLVALADGTTSLYTSTGGGTIGGGDHPRVASASRRFLAAVEGTLDSFVSTDSFPLPDAGRTIFYVLTYEGARAAEAPEEDLGEGRHQLSAVFHAGHDVITELRRIEGQRD